jgi:hypothetical protein
MKKYLVLLLLVSGVSLVYTSGASAVILCDNFGREWDIQLGACADWNAPLTQCLTGARDVNNEPGCGPLQLDGTYVRILGVFSVTTYDTPADTCVSAHWSGRGSLTSSSGSIEGNVSNEPGQFSTFTLGNCNSARVEGGEDPNQP